MYRYPDNPSPDLLLTASVPSLAPTSAMIFDPGNLMRAPAGSWSNFSGITPDSFHPSVMSFGFSSDFKMVFANHFDPRCPLATAKIKAKAVINFMILLFGNLF